MRWPILSSLVLFACPVPPAPPVDSGPPPLEDAGTPCLAAFPERLDFGEIEANTSAFTRVRLTNLTQRALQPQPTPVASPFSFDLSDFQPLTPGQSVLVTVRFTPADGLLHFSTLEVNAGDDCSLAVPLRGLGKGTFSVAPAVLDFGLVAPGERRGLQLTLSNTRRTPVTFDRIELRSMADAPPFSHPLAVPLTIPGGVTTSVTVSASPLAYQEYAANLSFTGPTAFAEVFLHVVGGAPVARLWPAVIDVPRMGFTSGSQPPSFVERRVWMRNDAPDEATFFSTLRLVPPFLTARTEDGGLTSDVLLRSGFDPVMPGEEQELLLLVRPPSLGRHRYQVVFVTNDLRQPEQRVDVSVNAEALGACSLQFPPTVLFEPTDAGYSTGVATFVNATSSPCLLDAVRLGLGSIGFHITDGGVDQLELLPGQRHEVWMTGPDAGSLLHSVLSFHVLGPDSVEQAIELLPPP